MKKLFLFHAYCLETKAWKACDGKSKCEGGNEYDLSHCIKEIAHWILHCPFIDFALQLPVSFLLVAASDCLFFFFFFLTDCLLKKEKCQSLQITKGAGRGGCPFQEKFLFCFVYTSYCFFCLPYISNLAFPFIRFSVRYMNKAARRKEENRSLSAPVNLVDQMHLNVPDSLFMAWFILTSCKILLMQSTKFRLWEILPFTVQTYSHSRTLPNCSNFLIGTLVSWNTKARILPMSSATFRTFELRRWVCNTGNSWEKYLVAVVESHLQTLTVV